MLQKYQIRCMATAAIVFFLGYLFVCGCDTWSTLVDAAGFAVTATCLLVLAYRKIIWKIDPFLDVPDFGKIDKVVLEFTHATKPNLGTDVPAEEGRDICLKEASFVCKQEGAFIKSMTLSTEQIKSKALIGHFIKMPDGSWSLYYIYGTDPNNTFKAVNPRQSGACVAEYDSKRGYWVGGYWTDQLTRGTIHFADYETVKKQFSGTEGVVYLN